MNSIDLPLLPAMVLRPMKNLNFNLKTGIVPRIFIAIPLHHLIPYVKVGFWLHGREQTGAAVGWSVISPRLPPPGTDRDRCRIRRVEMGVRQCVGTGFWGLRS